MNSSTTTLPLEVSHKEICGRLYSTELDFIYKKTNSFFEPPLGGVRGNVRTSSIAHWKARGQLPIHDN